MINYTERIALLMQDIVLRTPRLSFIERRYAGDDTNWWVPNRACTKAMLRSAASGMLETTQLSGLCTRVSPPARLMAISPTAPSSPMPLSTAPAITCSPSNAGAQSRSCLVLWRCQAGIWRRESIHGTP